MNPKNAARRVGELFPAIYRRFHRRIAVDEYRPSPESLAVLTHIHQTGPLTVGEAARHLHRSQAATSELIRRLVSRNLVERLRDERDRRRVMVWLTLSGQEVLRRSRMVLSDELLEMALTKLSADERDRLVLGMERLLEAAAIRQDQREPKEDGDDIETTSRLRR